MFTARDMFKLFYREFRMLDDDGILGIEFNNWRMYSSFYLNNLYQSGICTISTALAIAEYFGFDAPYAI